MSYSGNYYGGLDYGYGSLICGYGGLGCGYGGFGCGYGGHGYGGLSYGCGGLGYGYGCGCGSPFGRYEYACYRPCCYGRYGSSGF